MAELQKVNVHEFRNNIGKYLARTTPFAVTRHGQIVGYYIPAHPTPGEADRLALQKAASAFDRMLEEQGVSEEELFLEFRKMWQKYKMQ